MKKTMYAFLMGSLLWTTTGCDNTDDPTPVNEDELITTVTLTFTPDNGSALDSKTLFYNDADGNGGGAPVITGDTLDKNTLYTYTLSLSNTSQIPPYNVLQEIVDEATSHQLFYIPSGFAANFTYSDMDSNGNPIGIVGKCTTLQPGNGTLKVVLRHNLNKGAAGVANGNIANAGGDTDIEVDFPVSVQ